MIFVQTQNVKVLFAMKGQRLLKTVPIGGGFDFFTTVLLKIQVFQNAVNRSGTDTEYPEQLPDINKSPQDLC